jgi:hypothetical protein
MSDHPPALVRELPARLPDGWRVPRFVPLHEPDYTFDPELRAAFNSRTRLILINTPHNPTGRVFTRAELEDRPFVPGIWRDRCDR